ncbi:MAG TPA: hypothetical protein PK878_16730 [bacterium]|nr:hypothetical protein [bacterium]HOL96828.1 hypothetical protein [bacterium]HPP03183.1 hypothetical protein [bacterium]
MTDSLKPIRFSGHALDQIRFRGASEEEVIGAIRSSAWESAELGRLECRKNLPFQKEWNGILYETKQVRPIFVEEASEIVVVTVYVYYF